ncbi:MAG: hypothetical protein ACRD0O_00660 [Acidimicrobiia bacterium]
MKTMDAETPTFELPRYETAHGLVSEFELDHLDSTAFASLPAGIDLYLVFLEPAAL